MRRSFVAVISVLAAILGGATVLAVGKSAGWLSSRTTTLLVPAGPADAGRSAPVVIAKPVAGNGFRPAELYKERSPGVVTIIAYFPSSGSGAIEGGQGSGFVVSKTGTILTSAHVITTAGTSAAKAAPAPQVYVAFADGDRVGARIVGYDLFDDVGVLHVDPSEHALAPAPLGDSARVVVGEPAAAIGSPFGDKNSLSVGVVSAVRRPIPSVTSGYNLVDAIQTDAPINHGNSGGPLFDAAGRVIGINAQITSSGSNSGFEDVVRIVAEQLLPGQVARFTIVRGKKRLVLPVKLAERPAG